MVTGRGHQIAKRTRPFEADRAVSHSQNTYLGSQYRRLLPRLGPKRAALAVARSIGQRTRDGSGRGEPYADLGGDYFIQGEHEATKRRAIRSLEGLSYPLTLVSRLSPGVFAVRLAVTPGLWWARDPLELPNTSE